MYILYLYLGKSHVIIIPCYFWYLVHDYNLINDLYNFDNQTVTLFVCIQYIHVQYICSVYVYKPSVLRRQSIEIQIEI